MGNQQSGSGGDEVKLDSKKKKDLFQVVNFIASNYILTQSFEDMEALKDPKYCDKMILVTSDVLRKYLTNRDIKYLAQKMRAGEEVNEMTTDDVLFLKRDHLDDIDVKNTTTKRRMCIGIAKYYVKVAHIFSAIMMTINPSFSYKDELGQRKTVDFKHRLSVPKGTEVKINKVNLCSERVNALVAGQDMSMRDPTQPIKIKPNFCKMNLDEKRTLEEQREVVKTLGDETGIKQLERLYQDVYDYETGKFVGKSDAMTQEYKKDLAILYKAFTGKDEVPASVQTFSQIPLRDFNKMDGCKPEPNNQYMKEYVGTPKQKLFVKYAKHTKEMIATAASNRDSLIAVLDKVFVFAVNPQTKKPEITLSPKLTDDVLTQLVRETQELIIKLYITCEKDFLEGLKIFEQIIEKQSKLAIKKKIERLEQQLK